MAIFFNEGQSGAGSNLSKWNRNDTYTMSSISGITGPVVCHGPSPGQYTLTINNIPAHARLRYSVYWHFVDSLDNELSYIMIDGVLWAEFRKSGFGGISPPTYTINKFTSSTWNPANYSYAPWGSNNTLNGYVAFDTGWFDHTSSTLFVDHILGHDQGQGDEAMYLSHVMLEYYSEVANLPTSGLILRLDAGIVDSFPGKQKFVFRAKRTGTTESVIFTHYHQANSLPVTTSTSGFFTPPATRIRATTTTTTSTTTTTTEPPTPITINISSNLQSPILAHHVPLITFTFNLPVVAFNTGNVVAQGVGTLDNFYYLAGSTTGYANFNPTPDVIGSYTIFIPVPNITGTNGASNQYSNILTLNVNSLRPEMTITTSDALLIAGEVANVTFTSSNATGTFSSADVTLVGPGTYDSFVQVSSTVYKANVYPRASWVGEIEVNVAARSFTNVVGNFNKPSNVLKIPIDTRIPSMVITTNDSFLTYNQTATLTFTSNLATTNFVLGDVTTVGKGTLGALSGLDAVYTSVYTPQADEIAISASNYNQPTPQWISFIKLNNTAVSTVGRGHMAAVFDTSQGNIRFVSSTTKDTYGTPSDITDLISYLNAIPSGNLLVMTSFDATTVDAALRTTLNSNFGGVRSDTWSAIRYSHVFVGYKNVAGRTAYEDIIFTGTEGTLPASVYGVAGSFKANVQAATYTSANGNPNTSSNDLSLTYDTERPNMSIYSNDQYLTYGETSTVYFVATQPTTDFAFGDIVVSGDGALSGFTAVSNMVYTATLTPTTNTTGAIYISVPDSSFTNSVGNPNLASRIVKIGVMTVTTSTSTSTTTTEAPGTSTTTTTAAGAGTTTTTTASGSGTTTTTTTASGSGTTTTTTTASGSGTTTTTTTTTASGAGTTTTTEAPTTTTTTSTTTLAPTTTTTTAANPVSLAAINLTKSTHFAQIGTGVLACNMYIDFHPNGNITTQNGEGDIVDLGSWYTPETAAIGSGYFMRWTTTVIANTGPGNYYDGDSVFWLPLSTNRSFGVSAGSTSSARQIEVSYYIEIATDSGGSNIVATATHSLEALVSF